MSDYSELKRLAEAARSDNSRYGDADCYDPKFGLTVIETAFSSAATPAAVLALIAENERLSGECEGCPMSIAEELRIELDQFRHEVERYRQYGCGTCDGSGHLHRLDGEYFGACTSCGAYELEQAKRERDQLKAENERLRLALKSAEDAMWKSEANMDNEAADIRDLLAAMDQGERSDG